MKKLLTLATVALATVCVQAATTSWNWSVDNLNWDDGTNGDFVNSGFVQLVYGGTQMDQQTFDDSGTATCTITGNTTDAAFTAGAEWNAIVSVDIGGQKYEQTFLFTMPSGLNGDAQNDGQIFFDLNQTITATVMPNGYLDATTMESEGWTKQSGGDPVPEPTSVALLALGLAVLGLKRKVA